LIAMVLPLRWWLNRSRARRRARSRP